MVSESSNGTDVARDRGPSWFDEHPRQSIGLLYLVLIVGFVLFDFVSSNVHRSTLEIMLHERVPPMGHIPRSHFAGYYGVRYWNEFKNWVEFNNLGFRNDIPFTPETTAGKRIVFAVGDSTTACLEVPVRQSYPAVLEEELGPHVLVFNAGTRAYDTQQVILNYLTRIRPLKPDAVVYLICPNDYNNNVDVEVSSDYVRFYGKGLINDRLGTEYVEPVVRALPRAHRWRIWFKTNLNLTSSLANRATLLVVPLIARRHGQTPVETTHHYYTPETMRKMKQLLTLFDAETARDGVALYLAFMPEFEKDPQTVRSTEMYLAYAETRDFARTRLTNTVFVPTFDIYLEKEANRSQRPRFTFWLDPHANAYGNRWLGEVIGGHMRTNAAFTRLAGRQGTTPAPIQQGSDLP